MSRQVGLLSNPRAGSGGAAVCAAAVAARLRAGGDEVQELAATSAGAARDLAGAAVADGLDILVVAGGDGMVALGAGVCAGTDTALAIAAVGSGNDFARSVGLPVHAPRRAAELIAAGHTTTVDLGRLVAGDPVTSRAGRADDGACGGQRWFAGVLAAGFDAIVNARANAFGAAWGRVGYSLAVARELPVFRPIPYRLTLDGREQHTTAMLVAVGNGSSYGGGMRMCPGASIVDGRFDITIVHELSRTALLTVFPSVFTGSHVSHPAVEVVRARRVTIEAPDIVAYADGEPFAALPLTCEAVPGALRLITAGPGTGPGPLLLDPA